jgi:alanine dehydrogenase
MKIGIIREGKNPPDKRVVLTPEQCDSAMKTYPNLSLVVQPSEIRTFKDTDYTNLGIKLQNDLSDCDIILGVKEVNIEDLIENKVFFFFSHTYKLQPYNKNLLRAVLEKKIQLVDYEVLTKNGNRLIAFGRYAGIVGAYNGLRAWGEKYGSYSLIPAHACYDMKDMLTQLENLNIENPINILITGHGRVAGGAIEVLEAANIKRVSDEDFLENEYSEHVYAQLSVNHYCSRKSGGGFNRKEFYEDPSNYRSEFMKYAEKTDLYIACHYWDPRGPFLFTREDAKNDSFKIKMIADISCDIDGPIASTIRPSSVNDPFYGYDPKSEKETNFKAKHSIGVMAVDNLPCELPKDASESFGESFLEHILPAIMGEDPDGIIERGSETDLNGELSPTFEYLKEYINV